MPPAVPMPKIVFFGPPHSGKSSLVDAVQHTLTAAPGAEATTTDGTEADTGIRRELIPYRVRIVRSAVGPANAVYELIDCDGQAAAELISHADAVVRGRAGSAIVEAVRSADAIVVVFDATDHSWEVDTVLDQFRTLIDRLTANRTLGRAVGGLPIFLTLTKCDALGQPGDTPTTWQRRIEDRREKLEARFDDYFGKQTQTENDAYFSFGSLKVYSAATAVQVPVGPAFTGYADAAGTYGIGELTANLLPAALDHDERELVSLRRLRRTLLGTGGATFLMLLGLIVLTLSGGFGGQDRLADRVRNHRATEGPPAERLSEKRLNGNLKALTNLQNNAGFGDLPSDLRKYVEDRLAELNAYLLFRAKFQTPKLGPAEIRTWEQAEQLKQELLTSTIIPQFYRGMWEPTEVAMLREKWLKDLALSKSAQEEYTERFRGFIRRANELILTDKPPDYAWRTTASTVIREGDALPKQPTAEVPGSPAAVGRRGKPLTYEAVTQSERVTVAARDWADTRDRLRCLRDLADAVGLTTGPGTAPAVLDLPEPQAAPRQDLATTVLTAFTQSYTARTPSSDLGPSRFPEWYDAGLPEPIRTALELRLRTIRDTAHRHIRGLLKLEAAGGSNIAKAALTWAGKPGSGDWERLCILLDSLIDRKPASLGVVQELLAFSRQQRFEIPAAIVLEVPDDLLVAKAVPAGNLTLTVTPIGQAPRDVIYAPAGEPTRDRPLTKYTFTTAEPPAVAPGDGVAASLALRAGGQDYRLSWDAPRSPLYRFDGLNRTPSLTKLGTVPTPLPARTTRLTSPNPLAFPRLPVLFPEAGER